MTDRSPERPAALGPDQTRQPSRRLPLTPRRIAIWATPGHAGMAAARVLYQPRNRVRIAADFVARRLPASSRRSGPLPRVQSLVDHVAKLAGVEPAAAAALNVRGTERWLYALVRPDQSGVVVKIGREGDAGLEREGLALETLATRETALQVPELRWHGQHDGWHAIATDIVTRRDASADPGIDDACAAACALATMEGGFVVHGDLAPWNMVLTTTGVALVDWEDSRFADDPLYDLAHYVTRAGALLHAWRPRVAVRHLVGSESVGRRYLAEIGADPDSAPEHVMRYLRRVKSRPSSAPLQRYEHAMAETVASKSWDG
jgi:hypothetical protein